MAVAWLVAAPSLASGRRAHDVGRPLTGLAATHVGDNRPWAIAVYAANGRAARPRGKRVVSARSGLTKQPN
jgi:hypothetical protein